MEAPHYFMSHIVPVYKRALEWDQNFCMITQAIGTPFSYSVLRGHKIYMVGSSAEGAASPRLYFAPLVLEMDQLGVWFKDSEVMLTPDPDRISVYNVSEPYGNKGSLVDPVLHTRPANDSPRWHQDDYAREKDFVKQNDEVYPKWFDKMCSEQFEILEGSTTTLKGPSLQTQSRVHKISKFFSSQVLTDFIEAWAQHGWPREAAEWKTRQRYWPPEDVVTEILKMGHLVVIRWVNSTGDEEAPFDFSIAFTLVEVFLAKKRTPVQKLVYLMAKAIFYGHLDIKDDNKPKIEFPSYALKTCMMWLIEQTPEDRWTEDNTLDLLKELFSRLQDGVKSSFLKNYFMVRANVLHKCTYELLEKVDNKLQNIISDTVTLLMETKLYKANILHFGYAILTDGIAFVDAVLNGQWDVVDALYRLIDKFDTVRGTFKRITNILKRGTGDGLQARGYRFDAEECFCVLKSRMRESSNLYKQKLLRLKEEKIEFEVSKCLGKYFWTDNDLIQHVFNLEEGVSKPHTMLISLLKGNSLAIVDYNRCIWGSSVQDAQCFLSENWDQIYKDVQEPRFANELHVILLKRNAKFKLYKWSSMADLIDHFVQARRDEVDKWGDKIYNLTHRDSKEQQERDFMRMMHLLYIYKDKQVPG